MKTRSIKQDELSNDFFLVDLSGVRLGIAAVEISKLLIGKNKVSRVDYLGSGNNVIVINSDKVDFYPERKERKKYYTHSGFIGNLKERTLGELMESDSREVITNAVKGMLPKTKMGRKMLKNMTVYVDANFKEVAQKPIEIIIKKK